MSEISDRLERPNLTTKNPEASVVEDQPVYDILGVGQQHKFEPNETSIDEPQVAGVVRMPELMRDLKRETADMFEVVSTSEGWQIKTDNSEQPWRLPSNAEFILTSEGWRVQQIANDGLPIGVPHIFNGPSLPPPARNLMDLAAESSALGLKIKVVKGVLNIGNTGRSPMTVEDHTIAGREAAAQKEQGWSDVATTIAAEGAEQGEIDRRNPYNFDNKNVSPPIPPSGIVGSISSRLGTDLMGREVKASEEADAENLRKITDDLHESLEEFTQLDKGFRSELRALTDMMARAVLDRSPTVIYGKCEEVIDMASRQSAAFEDMEMAYKRVFESLENEKGESSEAAKKGREFLFVIEHTTADIVRISRSIVDLVEESETKFKEKMQNVRYKADFAEGLEKKLQLLSDSFVERDNARFLLKEIIDQLVGPPSWENQSNEGKYSF